MSIKKIYSSKDNTITNAYKSNLSDTGKLSNMGKSDIMEIFSIFGQMSSSSVEKTRILIHFPIEEIKALRDSGDIPASGKVNFYLNLHNARHGQTTPEDFVALVSPLLGAWEEGYGLDMEGYVDLGASNWVSGSTNVKWGSQGSDFINPDVIPAQSYVKTFDFKSAEMDMDLDITNIVEAWLDDNDAEGAPATTSIEFPLDAAGNSIVNTEHITLYDYAHAPIKYTFTDTLADTFRTGSDGVSCGVKVGDNVSDTVDNFKNAIETSHSGRITVAKRVGGTNILDLTQNQTGLSGNTKVVSTLTDVTTNDFTQGTKLKSLGLAVALSGSYEDGSKKRSFYTKKFFTRSSEYFFKRPTINIIWDSSIKDDRNRVHLSSPLLTSTKNLCTLAFYNHPRGKFEDVPNLNPDMRVSFHETIGGDPIQLFSGGSVAQENDLYATATRNARGIYTIDVAFKDPSKLSLYDVWYTPPQGDNPRTEFHTGSVEIKKLSNQGFVNEPEYTVKIKNLRSEYSRDETVRFRLYSRDKNQNSNIYTVATSQSPINIIEESYYNITRVSDGLEILPFSTGSVKYTKMSYDVSGSYFDIDMSLLESGHAYEMNFLYKDNFIYRKLNENFKFRIS